MGLLRDCLADPCPKVREAAAAGVCRTLHSYWEIIPAATSALFITKLTGGGRHGPVVGLPDGHHHRENGSCCAEPVPNQPSSCVWV